MEFILKTMDFNLLIMIFLFLRQQMNTQQTLSRTTHLEIIRQNQNIILHKLISTNNNRHLPNRQTLPPLLGSSTRHNPRIRQLRSLFGRTYDAIPDALHCFDGETSFGDDWRIEGVELGNVTPGEMRNASLKR